MRYQPSKAQKSSQVDHLTKPAVVPALITFGLEFGKYKYFPSSQSFGNKIDFGSKRLKTLNSFKKFRMETKKKTVARHVLI